ncbi:LPS assembly protein LptD [Shewanella intestini]|uniref:LPS-assembly protein LptD n=1 Tax=Shewanella intestini TaxID=2017544 RepID=A0ABS5HXR7_9GAMM|nr:MULTISPECIES: LPS assembly protein LptD [Shewanella]MBR9726411.1 LPS assembly protein LptD [Shewanella intestini]MRG35023.1 LPS assembly protein LptD [Shewanella sp. XMDDZSB0408]
MQIRYFLAVCLLSNTFLASQAVHADEALPHCVINPPISTSVNERETVSGVKEQDIVIISDTSHAEMDQKAYFAGDVSFSQGSRHIAADEALIDQQKQQLNANGNLVFQDSLFTVTADSLVAQMENNSAKLKGAKYWLHGQQVNGDAQELEITNKNDLILLDSNFTTCPPESQSWLLEAKKIRIDSDEEWGEIWDAKLRIADIPVMYIPYMTVPISDKRKSGFLFPSFSTSTTNGVEISTPYYWNIAPEYDLTFTPDFMSSRGLFLKTEFRYMNSPDQAGQVNVEYLSKDQKLNNSPDRYVFHWSHKGKIDDNWRVLANFTDVSDNNYFNDLSSDVNRATDNQLSRIGEASYFEKDWDLSLRVQDIKVLGEEDKPYQVMPQLSFNYRNTNIWNHLDFKFNSEVTNFSHQDNDFSTATRVHMAPSLVLPVHSPFGSFTSEMKLMQTNYWQQPTATDADLSSTVSRTIPQLSLNGKINFERDSTLLSSPYRQTFEPQFQYLYVGYQNQSDIGIYDSAQLQEDYFGLFRDRRFSGLDRIADANQMTLGFTTRLFDQSNQEKMKFSVGQIFYFDDSNVLREQSISPQEQSTSVLAAELDSQIYNDWFVSASMQHDTEKGENKKSQATLDYRPSVGKLIQFSYRYVPDLVNNNTNDKVNISQAGMRTTWPMTDDLYFVGNWYYDLNERRSIETYAGIQYESCCWAVRLSYHYNIKTNYDDDLNPGIDTREEFEKGVYLNFVIKGLGGSGPLGVEDMLNEGLFNYRKPLYLRN